MLWLGTAVLVALALFFLLRSFLRAVPAEDSPAGDSAAYDLEVYRDQLAEVGRDRDRGVIGAEDAAAAELEIKRRMLAADARRDADTAMAPDRAGKSNQRLGLGLALLLPVFAGGLYVWLGSPGTPSQPFAQRKAPVLNKQVTDLLARLEAAVKAKPDDRAAWLRLAQANWSLRRWRKAADAFGRAWKLAPDQADIGGAYAEALVRANRGVVTEAARRAFVTVNKADPRNPRARFFLGMAEAQSGRSRAALRRWILLEADTPPTATWLPRLRAEIAKAAKDGDIDVTALRKEVLANRPKRPATQAAGPKRGPTADDMRRAGKMTPEARMEMIRGMVSGLEARLKAKPDDLAGWRRLGRSYSVLGNHKKAAWAYGKAADLAPKSTAVQADYAVALMRLAGDDKPLSLEAVLVLRRLLALDPNNAFALYFLGRAEKEAGNPTAALVHWRKLMAQLPQNSPMRPRLAKDIEAAEKAEPPKAPAKD